jgi:hypothetical protein
MNQTMEFHSIKEAEIEIERARCGSQTGTGTGTETDRLEAQLVAELRASVQAKHPTSKVSLSLSQNLSVFSSEFYFFIFLEDTVEYN